VAKVITVYSESEYVSESLGEGMMVDNIQTRSHGGKGFQKKKIALGVCSALALILDSRRRKEYK
jgi:hypothetical protein